MKRFQMVAEILAELVICVVGSVLLLFLVSQIH